MPTFFTPETADEIIERVSNGETLVRVCRVDIHGKPRELKTFPSFYTVRDWADPADSRYRPEFGPRFARARLHQMALWIEETIDIADNIELGIEEYFEEVERLGIAQGKNTKERTTRRLQKDMTSHRALRIETRFKAAARLNPQMWAERLQSAGEIPNSENSRIVVVGGLPDDDQKPGDMIVDNDTSPKSKE